MTKMELKYLNYVVDSLVAETIVSEVRGRRLINLPFKKSVMSINSFRRSADMRFGSGYTTECFRINAGGVYGIPKKLIVPIWEKYCNKMMEELYG